MKPPRTQRSTLAPKPQPNDKLLVLTLAVILWQNRAPTELILALIYIAM